MKKVKKGKETNIEIAGTITGTRPKCMKGWHSIGECCSSEDGEAKEYWVKDDPPSKRDHVKIQIEELGND